MPWVASTVGRNRASTGQHITIRHLHNVHQLLVSTNSTSIDLSPSSSVMIYSLSMRYKQKKVQISETKTNGRSHVWLYMNERKTVDEKQENEKRTRSSKPSRKVSGIISRKPHPSYPRPSPPHANAENKLIWPQKKSPKRKRHLDTTLPKK